MIQCGALAFNRLTNSNTLKFKSIQSLVFSKYVILVRTGVDLELILASLVMRRNTPWMEHQDTMLTYREVI